MFKNEKFKMLSVSLICIFSVQTLPKYFNTESLCISSCSFVCEENLIFPEPDATDEKPPKIFQTKSRNDIFWLSAQIAFLIFRER